MLASVLVLLRFPRLVDISSAFGSRARSSPFVPPPLLWIWLFFLLEKRSRQIHNKSGFHMGCNPVDLVQIHFRPPAQNVDENGRTMDFGLTKNGPQNGKKGPKVHLWSLFRAIFPIFRDIFPPFSISGLWPEMDLYEGHRIARHGVDNPGRGQDL